MLPQALLRASAHLEGERIVPHYFSARDEPWLRALLDEYGQFVGRKSTELQARLREPLATGAAHAARAPRSKLRIAITVLEKLSVARPTAAAPAKEVRAALFRASAHSQAPRADVLRSVAASLAVSASELESALFADLPGERRIAPLPLALSPSRLVMDANLAIISSFMRRAAQVQIAARGDVRALLRHARAAGLICRESRLAHAADGILLDVSGPFALFHHSDLYGRALASLIPHLAKCAEFDLTASCAFDRKSQPYSLGLRSGELVLSPDPSQASAELPPALAPSTANSSALFGVWRPAGT